MAKTKKQQKSGLVSQALPERTGYRGISTADGQLQAFLPGVVYLTPPMVAQLSSHSDVFRYPVAQDVEHKDVAWFINILGDPEEYQEGLEYLAGLLKGKSFPVLNGPDKVLAVRRDKLNETLGKTSTVKPLRTLRFFADDRDCFLNHFTKEAMTYPVQVQIAGESLDHQSAVISNEEDWDRIYSIPWGSRWVYLTQLPVGEVARFRWLRIIATSKGAYAVGDLSGGYATEVRREESERVEQIGLSVLKATNLNIARVDLLEDGCGNLFIHDVSGAPEMRPHTGISTAHRRALRNAERDIWLILREITGLPLKMQLIHKL